jgi:predicted DNA-binding protein (UPF0251 family)
MGQRDEEKDESWRRKTQEGPIVGQLPAHQFPQPVANLSEWEKTNSRFSPQETQREMGHPAEPLPQPVGDQLQCRSQDPHPPAESAGGVGQPPGPEHEILVDEPEWVRQRRIYRNRTVAMLRRYMRYSIETGRLPSLLGREFFRAKVTSYTVVTFEDRVIFVHDMETSLEKLDEFSRKVLARIVLQEYEQEDAARLLGCTRMTVHRKLIEALDVLSGVLLEVGLLERLVPNRENRCQGGNLGVFPLSDCGEGK